MNVIKDWILNALAATEGWATWGVFAAVVTFLGFIIRRGYQRYQNSKTSRELVEYHFDARNVKQKRDYFIQTKFQNLTPSVEDEAATGSNYIAKEKLIPFFLKKAFRKKEKEKFYLVLADSGMGKTTFMINLYLRYNSLLNIGRRPYKIKLLPFGNKGILDSIQEIKKNSDVSKTILLLDAFDEYHKLLPSETPDKLSDEERFEKLLHEVIDLVQDFREIVMTSRTQYFPRQENKIYKLEIPRPDGEGAYELVKMYLSPFDDREVSSYLIKKYGIFRFWNRKKKKIAQEIVNNSPKLMVRPMLLNYIDDFVDGKVRYNNT